jgi:hypothetical protein
MPFFGVPIRNGVPIGLGSVAGFGISPFDPSYLFSAGEQGAWYDPSDLSTMFNDAAGTQPITSFTTNQPVGLLLDKSKGLVLGPELVTNGDPFVAGSWTLDGSAAVVGGKLVLTNTLTSTNAAYQTTPSVSVGNYYEITVVVSSISASDGFVTGGLSVGFSFSVFTSIGPRIVAPGTYTYRLLCQDAYINFRTRGGGGVTTSAIVDSISVKRVAGNHATASGSARPVLSKRYNLLERTEDLSNAYWSTTGVASRTLNVVGPNGTNQLTTITENTSNSTHHVFRNSVTTAPLNTPITISIILKAGTRKYLLFGFDNGASGVSIVIDTVTWGHINTTSVGNVLSSASVVNLGGGLYRATITGFITAGSTTINYVLYGNSTSNTVSVTYTGNGSTIIAGLADLRRTIDANAFQPAYQRVVTATDYDGDGFLPYLEYSGTQAMSTGSIDFTATDKMTVWTGVTKLSDAADAILTELSATVSTNNGSFAVLAPYSSTANRLGFALRGDTARTNQITGSSPYAAPVTLVSSISYDIAETSSATEILPRVNGVVPSTSTAGAAESGAGNFGNYPLYIGARNLTSVFLNGRMYSLIVRGAQSSAAQISATESWINQRTGAY